MALASEAIILASPYVVTDPLSVLPSGIGRIWTLVFAAIVLTAIGCSAFAAVSVLWGKNKDNPAAAMKILTTTIIAFGIISAGATTIGIMLSIVSSVSRYVGS